MNKEKLLQAGLWLSGFSLSVIISALALFIGFNNMRYDNYTLLVIGLLFLFPVFFCAYKALGFIISAIFEE